MVLGSEQLSPSLKLAGMIAPVAIYFVLLGLLNSRRRPQLLSARRDFALLVLAMSPLFAFPALAWIGFSSLHVLALGAVIATAIAVLSPRGHGWVIYNISRAQACRAIERALRVLDLPYSRTADGFELSDGSVLEVNSFALLRNVSIRLRSGSEKLAADVETELERTVSGIRAEASPMAVAMLLVASGMLVAPLALMAHRAGEIVRLLTDLLP
jgi:hypothetical protein